MKKTFILFVYICYLLFSVHAQEFSLDSCVSYALQNNKKLFLKMQHIQVADRNKQATQAKLFPQIKLSAGADYYWKIPVQTYPGELVGQPSETTVAIPIGTTWMANYAIEAAWKAIDVETWQIIRLESLKKQAAKASLHSFVRLVERNVSMAFYAARIAKDNKAMSQRRYESYMLSHQLIQKLFEQGLIDKIALNQSQNILNDYEFVLSKRTTEMESSLVDLKFWMGYPLEESISIKASSETCLPEHTLFAENNLPDYEEQQAKTDIARQEYKISRSRLLPNLSFVGNYGHNGFADNSRTLKRFSSWYPSGFIGLRVSIPLFSLTDIRTLKRQKAVFLQTLFEGTVHQEQQRKAFTQESLKLKSAWNSLQLLKEQMRLIEENEELSLRKIEKGIIDMIQLKQIQQELMDIQQRYDSLKIEYSQIYVELNYLQRNK
ncbi:MAG: TolC family protein [Dysgonamonadaceae bacterium]